MTTYEIRDVDEVRVFLAQGLWLQRVLAPTAVSVRPALEWSLELLSQGNALPPPGFVADVGHVALAGDWEARGNKQKTVIPGVPPQLLPTYEDHVLGKVYADWSFSHAAEALRKYREGRDRARGLAFILNQFRARAEFDAVEFSPGILNTVLDQNPDDLLRQGYESLQREGLHPYLQGLYESLIACSRRLAEVLGQADVIELQIGTALDEEGDRMAFRQVVQAADVLERSLPRHRVRPLARRMEVPTHVLDEDTYPVGGFASVSNRGTIESLLHSQLAYMDESVRPDLFDVKYLRDELLYYSRDENQFLRRRRTFVLAYHPDLIETMRFKDAELPYQRGILTMATLLVVMRKLCEWLSTDALVFDVVFFIPVTQPLTFPLREEFELAARLLREQVLNHTVVFDFLFVGPNAANETAGQEIEALKTALKEKVGHGTIRFANVPSVEQGLSILCATRARRSLCHCLALSSRPSSLEADDTVVTQFQVAGPRPALAPAGEPLVIPEGEEALESWCAGLRELLARWI